MNLPDSSSQTVFRNCVVQAARRGETLMAQVFDIAIGALSVQEASGRTSPTQRQWISLALQQMRSQAASLAKAYPMALVEAFAQGGAGAMGKAPGMATRMDELSIMDDAQIQSQVEFAHAHQMAAHTSDDALTALNALISRVQGLPNIQPERNPLRPESYIRALQQIVSQAGITPQIREIWMRYLREPLSRLLPEQYQICIDELQMHGVRPAGYAMAPNAGPGHTSMQGGYYASGYTGGYTGGYSSGHATSHTVGYGNSAMAGLSSEQAAVAQEALLTVGMLRQMLAAEGIDSRRVGLTGQAPLSAQAPLYPGQAGAEALQDMAELERLVGRLTQTPPLMSGNAPYNSTLDPMFGAAPPAAPVQNSAQTAAQQVVARMLAHLMEGAQALPTIQRLFRQLEPMLQQLVGQDPTFFSNDQHPARRMLDVLAQRSHAFASEEAEGFSRFVRVANEAVAHLAAQKQRDTKLFVDVLAAMESAWAGQAQRDAQRQQIQAQVMEKTAQRTKLAAQISAGVRKFTNVADVPADIMDFAAGPWAEVAALAHIESAQVGKTNRDPGGYLALIPELLWSVQPQQVGQDSARLQAMMPHLHETLHKGLTRLGYTPEQIQAFLLRLQQCHHGILLHLQAQQVAQDLAQVQVQVQGQAQEQVQAQVLEDPPPTLWPQNPDSGRDHLTEPAAVTLDIDLSNNAPMPPEMPSVHPDFQVGVWIDLINQRRAVRTQLTWASPNKTLFLFTAPDGSTQSMTRRMCAKLIAEGNLRILGDKKAP